MMSNFVRISIVFMSRKWFRRYRWHVLKSVFFAVSHMSKGSAIICCW